MYIKYPQHVSHNNPHGYISLFNIYDDVRNVFRSDEPDMFPPTERITCESCRKCFWFKNVKKHTATRKHIRQF